MYKIVWIILLTKPLRNFNLCSVYAVIFGVWSFVIALVPDFSLWKCYLIVYTTKNSSSSNITFQSLPVCNSPFPHAPHSAALVLGITWATWHVLLNLLIPFLVLTMKCRLMSQPKLSPPLPMCPCPAMPVLPVTILSPALLPLLMDSSHAGEVPALLQFCHPWLQTHLPHRTLTSTMTSTENFNSSSFLLENILPNFSLTICFYFRPDIAWWKLMTPKIMLHVLLSQIIHSLVWLVQMSVFQVLLDSVKQEEICGTMEDEFSVYEGSMKPKNNVWTAEQWYSKCSIHYLHFSKAFTIYVFFFLTRNISSLSLAIYHLNNKYSLQSLSGLECTFKMKIQMIYWHRNVLITDKFLENWNNIELC